MRLKLIILVAYVSICSLLHSTIWHIKLDGTGNFTTIQEGIDTSIDADTVLVYPGTYFENLDFNGKNIMLCSQELTTGNSQFINSTIIDGQRLESCIRIHNGETNAHVRGFTIQNGYGTLFWSNDGGGILVHDYSTAFITNCLFKNNLASQGGAIYARHGFLHLTGVEISDNYATLGGGVYLDDESTLSFDPVNLCDIYNNNAGRGADLYFVDSGNIDLIVDTFTVFDPSRFFAEYIDGSTCSFDIQNNWMELEPNDLYVAVDGDDLNSGLSVNDPLGSISWAVRKIQADEQNPRIIHVAAGTYSWAINQQIYPIGSKEYVTVIGEDMDSTILLNDFTECAVIGRNCIETIEFSNFSIRNSPENFTSNVMDFREMGIVKLSNIKIQNNSNIMEIFANEHVYNMYENIIVSNNTTNGIHGGLVLHGNAGYIKNSIISNNISIGTYPQTSVVAMQLDADDDFLVENCVFSNNHTINPESRIIRTTSSWGDYPIITFKNCLISDNSVNGTKILSVYKSGVNKFINCTFVNNNSSAYTIMGYGNIDLINTVMYNPDNGIEVFMADWTPVSGTNYTLNVDYSNIWGGLENGIYNQNNINVINWNEGNINVEPLFLLTGENPYQLTDLSYCIDAGTPDTTGLFLPPWDLLHHQRIWDGDGNGTEIIDMGCYEFGADSVGVQQHEIPIVDYELRNYPNPFNPQTTISFNLPESGQVTLEIFNIKGQKVKTLLNKRLNLGHHEITWNGKDDQGIQVGSGVYLYKMRTKNQNIVKKMILLK